MISISTYIYTLFSLRFENVTCRTKNEYIRWFENACFFSYSSNHIVSSFSLTSENAALKKVLLFHVVFDVKGPLHKVCDNSFIYYTSFDV